MSADDPVIDTEQPPVPADRCWFRTVRDRSAVGAGFLTAPRDRAAEIRCSMRDPDAPHVKTGKATVLVERRLADQAAARRETGAADGR